MHDFCVCISQIFFQIVILISVVVVAIPVVIIRFYVVTVINCSIRIDIILFFPFCKNSDAAVILYWPSTFTGKCYSRRNVYCYDLDFVGLKLLIDMDYLPVWINFFVKIQRLGKYKETFFRLFSKLQKKKSVRQRCHYTTSIKRIFRVSKFKKFVSRLVFGELQLTQISLNFQNYYYYYY